MIKFLEFILEIPRIPIQKYEYAINVNIDNTFFTLLADNVLGLIDVSTHNIQKIKVLDFDIVMLRK